MAETIDQDASRDSQQMATQPAHPKSYHPIKIMLWLVLAIVSFYPVSFFVIFDLTETAPQFDEEYFGGQQVAIGPRPRLLFEPPRYGQFSYVETQWPFQLYRPLCKLWLRMNHYAPPNGWR